MIVSYDSYDYPQYWQGRKYEDLAEKMALRKLLQKIPSKNSLVDIGGGFGRLTEVYCRHFKKCLLIDSSAKILDLAKKNLKKYKNIGFKRGIAQRIPIAGEKYDAALIIRLSHHLPDLNKAIKETNRILKPGGFFVLEFANKIHLKSIIKTILRRKLTYLLSHLPKDISTRKTIPFFNYHPSHIKSLLLSNQFRVIKILSVSNFRDKLFKKTFPLKLLLRLENFAQNSFAPFFLGPSIFILAQKENQK